MEKKLGGQTRQKSIVSPLSFPLARAPAYNYHALPPSQHLPTLLLETSTSAEMNFPGSSMGGGATPALPGGLSAQDPNVKAVSFLASKRHGWIRNR